MPPLEILDDPKLICMGKAMKNMISYQETPLIVAAVRPDYLLFPNSIGEMKRTQKYQYLQLTQGYTILPKIQPHTNSFATDVTIVVDENLWDFDTESIIKILLQLKEIKNIGFQEPIKIKKIIENEKLQNLFKELHFDKIYRNRFINNYGNDIKSIKKIIDFLGLNEYADAVAWGLPYGVLKKIEIARTLMCDPQLIILYEPAAGLNESETRELAETIKRIKTEYDCTILLVEHDMGLVMDICDTVCAISFGKLLCIGTPEVVQADKNVQTAYLGVGEE